MDEIPNLNHEKSSAVTRFTRWCVSPRILRRALVGVAGLMTLVAIIYARVNWRGRHEWEDCKRDMAARSEVWDWSVYAPAPVSDDQNIFKAPKMAEWFGDNRTLIDAPLETRVTNSFAQRYYNPDTTTEIKTAAAAAGYLAWSDQFQDDFDTIDAALQRPAARLSSDYSQSLSITLPNVASLYAVVKTLVQRAKCHLIVGQSDKAWRELTLLRDLRRMVEGQGKFITTEGDWMRREEARHCLQVIAKGLELHAWQEQQLESIQADLRNSDFIALHAEALKCARALLLGALDGGEMSKVLFTAGGESSWTRITKHPEFLLLAAAPRGVDYERAASVSRNYRGMINSLTPADGIIRPGEISKAFASWKRAERGLPVLLRTQTLVNEGQIACALERYLLAHGAYPDSLDTLVPDFIQKLPRDIINGEPLKYHRTDDGMFLLYSVGWNETDDGGQIVSAKEALRNPAQGDWVWKNSLTPE
jgi:hypothetical protein